MTNKLPRDFLKTEVTEALHGKREFMSETKSLLKIIIITAIVILSMILLLSLQLCTTCLGVYAKPFMTFMETITEKCPDCEAKELRADMADKARFNDAQKKELDDFKKTQATFESDERFQDFVRERDKKTGTSENIP